MTLIESDRTTEVTECLKRIEKLLTYKRSYETEELLLLVAATRRLDALGFTVELIRRQKIITLHDRRFNDPKANQIVDSFTDPIPPTIQAIHDYMRLKKELDKLSIEECEAELAAIRQKRASLAHTKARLEFRNMEQEVAI